MMTKHFANNSVLRRASQFENLNNDQSNSQPESSFKSLSFSRKEENQGQFINAAFTRFQRDFASLYPDTSLPFEEFSSLEEAKEQLKVQQQRIIDLNKEIHKAKLASKFLQEIISHNEKKDFDKVSLNNSYSTNTVGEDNANGESTSSKEQYVTVITLNDSTYGEIQRQKVSPNSSLKIDNNTENDNDAQVEAIKEELNQSDTLESTKEKSEPIYSNTLETNKTSDKVAKKRPPTPPRKPKFNKLQGSSGDIFGSISSSPSSTISKSESLKSISRIQRKFNGPLQQISDNNVDTTKSQDSETKPVSNSKVPYMRTVSHEPTSTNAKEVVEVDTNDDGVDSSLYKDYDNIYDTVAPDSDCDSDLNEDKAQSFRDEENETSSHEMLSRSSSTDEGLSNYVNIDYFLRKNSLGRSNSNIHARFGKKGYYESEDADEHEDNDTNMSSMKSSDYDNFSSNENLIDSIPPQTNSLKSFNSVSTNSSSGSSLRTRSLKILNNDLSASYPPNLSTFTPPIRERNQSQFVFPKDSPLSEKDESSVYSNGSELNLSTSSRNTSLDKSHNSSSVEYYAYTDILDSLPSNDSKIDNNKEELAQVVSLDKLDDSSGEEKEPVKNEIDHCRQMQWSIIRSIIESETVYLDCLNTLIQYMKALSTTTSGRENALLSNDDLNTIFYRIPELFQVHNTFLNGLKNVEHGYKMKHSLMTADSKFATKLMTKHSVGELFHKLASSLGVYSDFLRNYSKALETANRCSASNTRFSDIIKSIKIASLNGQFTNLVDLLHKPVARLQKNALVLHDLLKYVDSRNEEEQYLLKEALKMTQVFLNELNLDAARKLFPVQNKFQRRLLKESFIIESGGENRRKLRHLFLFNDVIVCAKYKASTKQKFTFELKWFQMLNDILLDPSLDIHCSTLNRSISSHSASLSNNSPNAKDSKDSLNSFLQVEMLKSRAFACRYDMFIEEKKSKGNSKVADKFRKKISELESELVLWLPLLKFSFNVKNNNHKSHIFYLSSEYERSCWFDSIKRMQSASLNSTNSEQASLLELQRWIESCRKSINPNLGSFLLRTNKDESLRFGDLSLRFVHLNGFNQRQNLFFVVETDSYGHYFKHAITNYVTNHETENINQEFLIELEGTQSLRILCYESPKRSQNDRNDDIYSKEYEANERTAIFKGKASFDLTSSCLSRDKTKELSILDYSLSIEMSYTSWKSMMEKIPPNKICGTFAMTVAQVCKKEKSKVPYLIMSCVNEVQRRGLKEVGIYRVSGLNSDIQRLRKAFETSPRDASWLIGHIDIHAVTGLLKLYLRELPESLFTNDMYKKYLEARDFKNVEEKERRMTSLLSQLPEPNQSTVVLLIDHLALVNHYEEENKMSLNNLATIFGPTMLRTNSSGGNSNTKISNSMSANNNQQSSHSNVNSNFSSFVINTDLFTASTIDVMAQADILYFFLRRKAEGLSLTSIDREETSL